jgi:pilus assembly protein CpaE
MEVSRSVMNRAVVIASSNDDIAVPLWHALERARVHAEIIPSGPQARQALRERLLADDSRCWGVIVDAAGGGKQPIEFIRELRAAAPKLLILAALASPDLRTTKAVTAAGAWDYLIQPFDAEQIEALVRLWDRAGGESPQPGRLLCVLPARGGDGASTVALHIADAAAREHQGGGFSRKVLLVDLDFQSGDLAFRLQLAPGRTVADALEAPESSRLPFREWVCPWREVDLLAAPPANVPLRTEEVRRIPALFSSAKAAYPLVVADMPPAMYSSSREVLGLADEIYVVCTPEIASVHLARRRVEELLRIGVARDALKLVLNRAGSHAWIGAEEVGQVAGLPVSALLGNEYRAVSRAVLEGGVVARRSPLGRQFGELGREALGSRVRARVAAAASG